MSTDFRYSDNAQKLDDDLVAELTAHRDAKTAEEMEAKTERDIVRAGGLEQIAGGTPLDQVKAIIEKKKKRPAATLLKEHEAGKKMAEMASRGSRAVDNFLGTKG